MNPAIVLSLIAIAFSLIGLGFCVAFCVREWRNPLPNLRDKDWLVWNRDHIK